MKMLSWIVGVLGIIIAFIGVLGGIKGVYAIKVFGNPHAPSTFLVVGIFLLVIGIWLAVLKIQQDKK